LNQFPIITLTTDWNLYDYYVGSVKGRILSKCPEANIIDITHQIQTYKIQQAAFVLRNSYKNFPDGTIHIIAVNTNLKEGQSHLVIKTHNQYFISADNGIFSLIFKEKPQEVIQIKNNHSNQPFSTLSVYADIASNLAKSKPLKELGTHVNNYEELVPLRPTIDENAISGSIIYIDSFQNAITNISKALFDKVQKNKKYEILIQSNKYKVNKISNSYQDVSDGELVVLFNSIDLLEIAINNGNASELLNLNINSSIRINFSDQ